MRHTLRRVMSCVATMTQSAAQSAAKCVILTLYVKAERDSRSAVEKARLLNVKKYGDSAIFRRQIIAE